MAMIFCRSLHAAMSAHQGKAAFAKVSAAADAACQQDAASNGRLIESVLIQMFIVMALHTHRSFCQRTLLSRAGRRQVLRTSSTGAGKGGSALRRQAPRLSLRAD